MAKIFLFALFFFHLLSLCAGPTKQLLIEAESFQTTGGWVIDPQFVEQMGSPYLLAHGMGKPVENAKTTVSFPSTGIYHIWVRTKNWVPGDWKAPGRFKLIVNGTELETELGTQSGWTWQYDGNIKIDKKQSVIELHDLTGFEGRCDAIYFNTEKTAPPSSAEELAQWRKKLVKEPDSPKTVHQYDLVIVGGGIAGCAAAIVAAEQGLNVAIVHDRPVLGGNASSEVRVHTEGITGYSDRILSMLNSSMWKNGSPKSEDDVVKRHTNIEKYKNIKLYLNYRAYGANASHNFINSVDARHTSSGETTRFKAPLFIDCTGDGWIGYWAGADYLYGREDSTKFGEAWSQHGELWSGSKSDNRVMGASILWRSKKSGTPAPFPAVPWAKDVAKSYAAINGEWQWEYSDNDLQQIEDAEQIRDHLLQAIYGSFYNAKQDSRNDSIQLEWVGYVAGKRESRRLMGDYIYTFEDEKTGRKFPDGVVVERRAVDVHFQQMIKEKDKPDFLSEAMFYKTGDYYIPYRTLYSRNINNLLMAGRCFSCSHIGLGGPRVMNTTGQMGVAVGYAASLCKKYKTDPRGVYKNHIIELRKLIQVKD